MIALTIVSAICAIGSITATAVTWQLSRLCAPTAVASAMMLPTVSATSHRWHDEWVPITDPNSINIDTLNTNVTQRNSVSLSTNLNPVEGEPFTLSPETIRCIESHPLTATSWSC